MANELAQEYLKKYDSTRATLTQIDNLKKAVPATDKLTGKLVIENYPKLKKITLSGNEITELVVRNCPELDYLSTQGNKTLKLLKLDGIDPGGENKLTELICTGNEELETFSLKNCVKLKSFYIRNCIKLTKIGGLHDSKLITRFNAENVPTIRHILEDKLTGYQEAKKVLKEVLGLNPDEKLPDSVRTGGKLDAAKLRARIENEIINASQLQTEKENAENERDAAQAQLETQKDYNDIKTERDQLKQNLKAIVEKLGLTEQSTQVQILAEIERLRNKPDNDNSDKISDLERQLSEKNQQISELENRQKQLINHQNVIESVGDSSLNKLGFALSSTQRTKIVDASNSQEAWKIRDQAIKERFGELEKARKNAFYLNIGLGTLLILSLFGAGWLLVWKTNPAAKDKEGISGQPTKKQIKQKSKSIQ